MHDAPGSSDWSKQEIYDIMKSIAKYSVEYYIKNYGE